MTPEELNTIRERCEKATPGPWTTDRPTKPSDPDEFSRWVAICGLGGRTGVFADPPGGQFPWNDAQFIAHAREDIPALLDHIKDIERCLSILSDEYEMMKEHLESKIPRWIPVSEKLPEEWEYVLFAVPNQPPYYKVVGYRMENVFRDHTHHCVKEVTHWMPLPKGPEEGEG